MKPMIMIIYDAVNHTMFHMLTPTFFYGRLGMRIEYQFIHGKEMP